MAIHNLLHTKCWGCHSAFTGWGAGKRPANEMGGTCSQSCLTLSAAPFSQLHQFPLQFWPFPSENKGNIQEALRLGPQLYFHSGRYHSDWGINVWFRLKHTQKSLIIDEISVEFLFKPDNINNAKNYINVPHFSFQSTMFLTWTCESKLNDYLLFSAINRWQRPVRVHKRPIRTNNAPVTSQ